MGPITGRYLPVLPAGLRPCSVEARNSFFFGCCETNEFISVPKSFFEFYRANPVVSGDVEVYIDDLCEMVELSRVQKERTDKNRV